MKNKVVRFVRFLSDKMVLVKTDDIHTHIKHRGSFTAALLLCRNIKTNYLTYRLNSYFTAKVLLTLPELLRYSTVQRDPKVVQFYSSGAWKKCRASYKKSVGGLCENCLAKGIYTPGDIVHHTIEHITPDNVDNPEVTLSFDNLQLLCQSCHNAVHFKTDRRYVVDEFGKVTAK